MHSDPPNALSVETDLSDLKNTQTLMPLVSGVSCIRHSPHISDARQWGDVWAGLQQHGRNGTTSGPGAERQAETQENLRKQRDADDEKRLCNTLQDAIDKFQASKLFLRDFPITSH